MKIKTYAASNLEEAFKMMKFEMDEYGYNSSVLHTRSYVKGGIFGIFGKPIVELTTAIEERNNTAKSTPPRSEVTFQRSQKNNRVVTVKLKKKNKVKANSISRKRCAKTGIRKQYGLPISTGMTTEENLPDSLKNLNKCLLSKEIDPLLVKDLIHAVQRNGKDKDLKNENIVKQIIRNHVTRMLNVAGPIRLIDKHLKIAVFVGPTGVGKTTTIAKLAADFAFNQKKKVALFTIDTYRIAAVEQLRTYAQIMNLPIEVAHSPMELKLAVNRHSDKDVILIDTAGRSPRNDIYMMELKNFLDNIKPVDVHLVLNAGTRGSEMIDIAKKYNYISINSMVLTKLDEISHYGEILNLKDNISIPISYLTNGQNVPKDIEVADPNKLAELIL